MKLVSLLATGLLLVSAASATTIQLATNPISSQPVTNGDASVKTWVDQTIVAYNALPGTDLPAAGAQIIKVNQNDVYAFGPTFNGTQTSITLNLSSFVGGYLVLGWGGSTYPNNTDGTTEYLYYISDSIGASAATFTNAPSANGGLSAIHVFAGAPSVPDAGSSVALLGAGLLALAAVRRKFGRA